MRSWCKATWIGALIAVVMTETIGVVAAVFPRAWLTLFDQDPAMIEAGTRNLARLAVAGGAWFGPLGWPRSTDRLLSRARQSPSAVMLEPL